MESPNAGRTRIASGIAIATVSKKMTMIIGDPEADRERMWIAVIAIVAFLVLVVLSLKEIILI